MWSYWIIFLMNYNIIKRIFVFNILFCIKPFIAKSIYVAKSHLYLGMCHFMNDVSRGHSRGTDHIFSFPLFPRSAGLLLPKMPF